MGRHSADDGAAVDPVVADALARRSAVASTPAPDDTAPIGWPGPADPGDGDLGWPGDLPDGGVARPQPAPAAEPAGQAPEQQPGHPEGRRGWRRLLGGRRAA
jgi:hypothetical protein